MKAQVSPKNTHPTSRNFWVVREKVSPKEKFPIGMDFKVKKKTQVSPKKKISNKQEDLNWENSET